MDDARSGLMARLSLAAGALCACEIGALMFGHRSPIDGGQLLWAMDAKCRALPWLAQQHNHLLPHARPVPVGTCPVHDSTVWDVNLRAGAALVAGALPMGWLQARRAAEKLAGPGRVLPRVKRAPGHVVVDIGRSTGVLAERGLTQAGLRAGQKVSIVDLDLCLNTIIMGEIGVGKTSAALLPFLRAVLEQGCGAVIGSGKGNIHRIAQALGEQTGREIRVIGFGEYSEGVDLCATMTPETGKGYLSSLLRAQDRGKDSDSWINTAVNLTRGILGLLKMYEEEYPQERSYFSYPGVYRYLYGRGGLNQVVEEGMQPEPGLASQVGFKMSAKCDEWRKNRAAMSEDQREAIDRKLEDVESYHIEIQEYLRTSPGIRTSIDHALRQVLSQLSTPAMEAAFFNKKPRARHKPPFSFAQTYRDGAVFVIYAPEEEIGADTSALILSLVKSLFFHSMSRRLMGDPLDEGRLVGLFLDEVQDYVSGSSSGQNSDHTALAKLRETRAFCVWATQSYNMLEVKLGATMTKALLANFLHKIVFRLKDVTTQDDALKLLGDVEVEKESTSVSRQPGKFGTSKSTSKSRQMQATAKAELFLNLKSDEALFISTLFRESAVDVIKVQHEVVAI